MNNYRREFLIECIKLNAYIDDIIEKNQIDMVSLPYTLNDLLKNFIQKTGLLAGFIYTYDDNLDKKFFYKGKKEVLEKYNLKLLKDISAPISLKKDDKILFAQPIDVAGEKIGSLGFISTYIDAEKEEELKCIIDVFSEQLDNYLYNHNNARKKQKLIEQLNLVLRNPILSVGIKDAVDLLSQELQFKHLAIIHKNIENLENSWHITVFEGSRIILDNNDSESSKLSEELNKNPLSTISHSLLDSIFEKETHVETCSISGDFKEDPLGKIFVSSKKNKGFNTYAKDLIEVFSQIMTYRFLDFTKEIKKLRRYFSTQTTQKLLSIPEYNAQHLQPRIDNCLILFTDLNSFTKISEQVLNNPEELGVFIDRWSSEVIDILYKYDGVFDKMVGDCVIGIFGPPFFENNKKTLLKRAIQAIREIEAFTISLANEFPKLLHSPKLQGLGVATGINYAPLNVGFFGRYEDYTGFSSGMNNTARLQALAGFRETFIMDNLKPTLDELIAEKAFDFSIELSQEQSASVKNVQDPLAYYSITFNSNNSN